MEKLHSSYRSAPPFPSESRRRCDSDALAHTSATVKLMNEYAPPLRAGNGFFRIAPVRERRPNDGASLCRRHEGAARGVPVVERHLLVAGGADQTSPHRSCLHLRCIVSRMGGD